MKDFDVWKLTTKHLPKRMPQGDERKDRKQEQNSGNGYANRRLLTQLLIQVEMNCGGRSSEEERWRKVLQKWYWPISATLWLS